MIHRGTTPRHYFQFPFKQEEINALYISYWQEGAIRVEKTLNDVGFDTENSLIWVDLSQEDTLEFQRYTKLDRARDSCVLIQIRIKLVNGQCWMCEPIKERVTDIIKDGII